MPGDLSMPVALIGCGSMARAYLLVLRSLDVPFIVIGRQPETAEQFRTETGITPIIGGLAKYLTGGVTLRRAIVAVDVPNLQEVCEILLSHGVCDILVEKPAGISPESVSAIARQAQRVRARVIVAYNRRYFASVRMARRMIDEDGSATSCCFDFTERAHDIVQRDIDRRIKQNWFYANSTHVLDLAFFLAGVPVTLTANTAGGLDWHPAGAIFIGCGSTDAGALFSYHANWTGPGRWGVEVMTSRHRLVLQPLEELRVQRIGSFTLDVIPGEDDLDQRFKPGLYRQTSAFLSGEDDGSLLRIEEHSKRMAIYAKILHGCGLSAGIRTNANDVQGAL